MGRIDTLTPAKTSVRVGIATYTNPKTRPIDPPMVKQGHFQVCLSEPLSSARAIAPRAAWGAVGKGRRSRSETSRKRTYPEVNQVMRPTRMPSTSRAMGRAQSMCRKVRCTIASESGAGENHPWPSHFRPTSFSVRPNWAASGEPTKYWRQISCRKVPVSARTISCDATYVSRKISCRLSVVKERLAISRKRITVTHCAASPMPMPVTSPRYICPGVMMKAMNSTPTSVLMVYPCSKRSGACNRSLYSWISWYWRSRFVCRRSSATRPPVSGRNHPTRVSRQRNSQQSRAAALRSPGTGAPASSVGGLPPLGHLKPHDATSSAGSSSTSLAAMTTSRQWTACSSWMSCFSVCHTRNCFRSSSMKPRLRRCQNATGPLMRSM